jgi:hypothetical protein
MGNLTNRFVFQFLMFGQAKRTTMIEKKKFLNEIKG